MSTPPTTDRFRASMLQIRIRATPQPGDVPKDAPWAPVGCTAWYHGQQLPVQIGVYQRLSLGGSVLYSLWDGAHWLWQQPTADRAARVPSCEPSLVQHLPWRGLSAPPAEGYGPATPQRHASAPLATQAAPATAKTKGTAC
jgi:hypothetical protein